MTTSTLASRTALLLSVTALAALTACSTGKKKYEVTECTFPGEGKAEAPLWICAREFDGYKVTGIGSFDKSPAGANFAIQQAAALARVDIATQFRAQIKASVSNVVAQAGTGDKAAVDAFAENVSKQVTNESLAGAKIVRTATSPKGTTWVIVGLDKVAAEAAAKATVQSSLNNQAAQWQRYQGKKSLAELEADIARLP